ncbi:MAG: AAA family ATPase, partial [Methanomassiliicoccales archaeon]
MQINRFKTRRFAGLRDIELEFSDGLSIILGPNEAGKSTLVEALRLGLISPVSLKGQDKIDFEKRFMPLYGGDSVDLELTVGTPKGSLRLFKTFGNRPSAQLEVGQGAMVSRETLVYQQLNSIFGCGEKTIDTLVFGRQGEFQNLFAQVTAQDLAKGLSMVLHQAVLEMDGISVKLLENRIRDEVDGLLNRWDLDKGCPEGGRSIERPYHKGVGKVLDTFYQREQLGQQMKQVLQTEQRLSALAAQNQELTIAIIAKQQEIKTLAELEDDMIHRLELEPLAQSLAEQLAAIEADNQEWPVAQHNLQRCQDRLAEACTRLSLLKVEEEHSRAREEHRVLRELLTSVEKCRTQEETLLAEATTITVISEAQLGELETMSRHMEDLKVALRAARMQTNLKLAPGVEGKLICDFDEVEITDGHQNYTAEGYLRLEISGVVIFEVQ